MYVKQNNEKIIMITNNIILRYALLHTKGSNIKLSLCSINQSYKNNLQEI